MNKHNFAMIIKPVGSRCNMNCRYCYYLEKGKFSSKEKQTVMSTALLEKLIKQTIEANAGPIVSFTWHGGEPTLAGIDFFKKAVELEKKYLPKGWQCWNNLQTNGLLLNEKWCNFLKENHFDVGLSIDGDQITHDTNRLDKGMNPTYQRITKSIKLLQAVGIQPDLLCTVTSDSLKRPLEIYHALKSFNTGWIQFIPVVVINEEHQVDPISISPIGYGEFLCTIFDEWIKNDLGKLDVQLFAETTRVFAGGTASVCTMAPTCGQVLIGEEDGSIYSCDHFVDDEHRLGTLYSSKLGNLVNSEFQQNFGLSKKETLSKECKQCPWLSCCQGGCLKDRFAINKDNEKQYYLCEGLKMFFSKADKPLHIAMEMSRNGNSSQKIMEYFKNNI